jgi:hypothetical protein
MKRKKHNIEITLWKLNYYRDLAINWLKWWNEIEKYWSILIFSNIVDFYTMQIARSCQQVKLKWDLAINWNIELPPYDIFYLYDEKVDTRKLLKWINGFVPFSKLNQEVKWDPDLINNMIEKYINSAKKFLNCRNALIHNLFNPNYSVNKIKCELNKWLDLFFETEWNHHSIINLISPYMFSFGELNMIFTKNAITEVFWK